MTDTLQSTEKPRPSPAPATQDATLVQITNRHGHQVQSKIRALGPGRFTVSFDRHVLAEIGSVIAGEVIDIVIPATGTAAEAQVEGTTVMGHVEVCQCRVVRHLDGPEIGKTDDRRSSTRFAVDRTLSAILTTWADPTDALAIQRSVSGKLADLSIGGCGVRLGRNDAERLGQVELAHIEFKRPDTGTKLELVGERKNSRLGPANDVLFGFSWAAQRCEADAMAHLKRYLETLA